jgi:hypothetical protein
MWLRACIRDEGRGLGCNLRSDSHTERLKYIHCERLQYIARDFTVLQYLYNYTRLNHPLAHPVNLYTISWSARVWFHGVSQCLYRSILSYSEIVLPGWGRMAGQ